LIFKWLTFKKRKIGLGKVRSKVGSVNTGVPVARRQKAPDPALFRSRIKSASQELIMDVLGNHVVENGGVAVN
jgi:hypothetical protein